MMVGGALSFGEETAERQLAVGDRVRDRHGRNADLTEETATVVAVLGETTAEEYVIEATGRTVAAENPEYPASDSVVAAVWEEDPAEKRYHFPRSRLVRADRIMRVDPGRLQPSPLAVRSFIHDENTAYIEEVAKVGGFRSFLVARPTPSGLELLEGHKRRWVADEADLETVDVIIERAVGDQRAAAWYLADHWPGLSVEQRATAHRRLRTWLPTAADRLITRIRISNSSRAR